MKTKQAPINYTKLYVNQNKNNPSHYGNRVKVGTSKVYFERTVNKCLSRMTKLMESCNAGLREFTKWYWWNDGLAVNAISKNFMAIYTGSVVYGVLVEEESEEESKKRLEDNQFKLYYDQAEKWFKKNPHAILSINYRSQRVVNNEYMVTHTRENYISTYNHNISIINQSINSQEWKDAYVKVYENAIENIDQIMQ